MEYLIIAIEPRSVTAARFTLSGRSATMGGSASFVLDEQATLADVARTIGEGIRSPLRVVLCLPPRLFAHRLISLPLPDLRKVREILPAHFQGEIALPAEEAVFDALPAGEGRYLALWARREEIDRAVATFREAGCEPQIVSSVPFAWPYLPGIPGDCAVCDGSALALLSGGSISSVRALDESSPADSLSATLTALELSGTTLPPRLIVFGEQAVLPVGDEQPLPAENLELPAEAAVLFRTNENFHRLGGLYAVVRACHAGRLPDFRRGDLAWTAGDAAVRKRLRLTAVLAFAAVILLFVRQGMEFQAARADLASLNSSIGSLYREIFPGRTRAVDELSEVKGEIRKLSGVDNAGAVLDTLRRLAEARGSTINGLFEAEVEGRTVQLKGDARSAQAVNEFKTALSGILSAVEAGEIKSRPDGTVSFSLTGTLKEGRP